MFSMKVIETFIRSGYSHGTPWLNSRYSQDCRKVLHDRIGIIPVAMGSPNP